MLAILYSRFWLNSRNVINKNLLFVLENLESNTDHEQMASLSDITTSAQWYLLSYVMFL